MFFNFCVGHKKGVSGKHPIWENKLLLARTFFIQSVLRTWSTFAHVTFYLINGLHVTFGIIYD